MSPRRTRVRREVHYSAFQDVACIDGLMLPGAIVDDLRDAPNGALFRVRHVRDNTTRLERPDADRAPQVSDHCRELASQIKNEGGDKTVSRCLVEAAEQIDTLRHSLTDVVRQLNEARQCLATMDGIEGRKSA